MSTSGRKRYPKSGSCVIHNGDAMTQTQFHKAYCSMPPEYRAELIGGIVFEPSPLGLDHGTVDVRLAYLLEHYAARIPGVCCALNATVILSEEDEVQPDILMRIDPKLGGQSCNQPGKKTYYVKGAPELVAEVAHTSFAIDFHLKKQRYNLAGVGEYLVVCLEPARIYWFDREGSSIKNDKKRIYKSRIFPGLWIDAKALLNLDFEASMAALNAGMQTKEYAKFVSLMAERKARCY